MAENNYLSIKDLAKKENVSESTIYRLCHEGFICFERIPTKKGKGSIRVKEESYNEYKKIYCSR